MQQVSYGTSHEVVSPSNDNPQNLPTLPVPKLSETLSKYLISVRPVLSDEEYCTTKRLVDEFQHDEVTKELQNFLEQRALARLNWLAEWKINVTYLGYRPSVVIYSSPGQSLPLQHFRGDNDRICYTAKLILGAATYIMLLKEKKIPIDKKGENELDMSQYFNIFGTIRLPRSQVDGIDYYPNSEHIIVVHKNHYFRLQLFVKGKPLSEKQICEQLHSIMQESTMKGPAIGILSADHRDVWVHTYCNLAELNLDSVTDMEKSLFLVCLDDAMPPNKCANIETERFLQFIHGGGSEGNTGNRWFDKTVQFIVGCSGNVGLIYEHSPCEGQPIAVIVDYVVNFINKSNCGDIPDNLDAVPSKRLHFQLNDDITSNIATSEKNIDKLVSDFQLICFKFEKYGKEFIKVQNLSPDSYLQMAIQLALYRMCGKPIVQYETTSTRMYVGGRTGSIRSCSTESINFAQCMLDKSLPDKTKVGALRIAVNGHKEYANDAEKGYGVDRHFLGLQLAAKDLGYQLHEFFTDVGYTRSAHFRTCTSQVATKCDSLMAYGPRTSDGYTVCYNPHEYDINFALTAWASDSDTNIEEFKACLVQSLCEMQSLLCQDQQ